MAWLYLFVAGLFEVGWAIGLKYTEGFTRLVPSVLTATAMVLSVVLLGIAGYEYRQNEIATQERLKVIPGLTGLWQVSGRNNVRSFKDWVRLDLEYIDHWSLSLDFKILVRTIPAVFRGTGAK